MEYLSSQTGGLGSGKQWCVPTYQTQANYLMIFLRHRPCTIGRENRQEFPQDIFRVVHSQLQHPHVFDWHSGTRRLWSGNTRFMSRDSVLQHDMLHLSCLLVSKSFIAHTRFEAERLRSSTWGPRLGMRQMVQARFSFG